MERKYVIKIIETNQYFAGFYCADIALTRELNEAEKFSTRLAVETLFDELEEDDRDSLLGFGTIQLVEIWE